MWKLICGFNEAHECVFAVRFFESDRTTEADWYNAMLRLALEYPDVTKMYVVDMSEEVLEDLRNTRRRGRHFTKDYEFFDEVARCGFCLMVV